MSMLPPNDKSNQSDSNTPIYSPALSNHHPKVILEDIDSYSDIYSRPSLIPNTRKQEQHTPQTHHQRQFLKDDPSQDQLLHNNRCIHTDSTLARLHRARIRSKETYVRAITDELEIEKTFFGLQCGFDDFDEIKQKSVPFSDPIHTGSHFIYGDYQLQPPHGCILSQPISSCYSLPTSSPQHTPCEPSITIKNTEFNLHLNTLGQIINQYQTNLYNDYRDKCLALKKNAVILLTKEKKLSQEYSKFKNEVKLFEDANLTRQKSLELEIQQNNEYSRILNMRENNVDQREKEVAKRENYYKTLEDKLNGLDPIIYRKTLILSQFETNLKSWVLGEEKRKIEKENEERCNRLNQHKVQSNGQVIIPPHAPQALVNLNQNQALPSAPNTPKAIPDFTRLLVCWKILNLNKQVMLNTTISSLNSPFMASLYKTGNLLPLFGHFLSTDFVNGSIPKLDTPKLKLFFKSRHIDEGNWVQFLGDGSIINPDLIPSQFALCNFGDKLNQQGISDSDHLKTLLSPSTVITSTAPSSSSSTGTEWPYDFIIEIKWEIS
jgi:hypothetical protein